MTPQEIPLAHARYASNRLQRLAGNYRPDGDAETRRALWRFEARELASSLRELATYCDAQSRRACDDCPAELRSVAAHVLAWHDSRGMRGEALAEMFTLLAEWEERGSGADLGEKLADWAARCAALRPPTGD